jgi:hypothetical protein
MRRKYFPILWIGIVMLGLLHCPVSVSGELLSHENLRNHGLKISKIMSSEPRPTAAPTTAAMSTDTSRKGSDDDFIQFRNTDYSFLYLFNFLFAGSSLILLFLSTFSLYSRIGNKETGRKNRKAHNSILPYTGDVGTTAVNHKEDDEEPQGIQESSIEDATNLNPGENSDDFFDFMIVAEYANEIELQEQAQQQPMQHVYTQQYGQMHAQTVPPLPPLLQTRVTPSNATTVQIPSATTVHTPRYAANAQQPNHYRQPLYDCFGLLTDRRERNHMFFATGSRMEKLCQRIYACFPFLSTPPQTTLIISSNLSIRRVNVTAVPSSYASNPASPRLETSRTTARGRDDVVMDGIVGGQEQPEPNFFGQQWSMYMNSLAFCLLGWHFGLASFGMNSLGTQYYAANIIITNIISIFSLVFSVFHLLYRRMIFVFYGLSILVALFSTSMIVYFDK